MLNCDSEAQLGGQACVPGQVVNSTVTQPMFLAMEPPSLPPLPASEYDMGVWQSLRPFLKSRGYRLMTQRDMARMWARTTKKPVKRRWCGPDQDDDALCSSPTVRCPFPCFVAGFSENTLLLTDGPLFRSIPFSRFT
jgi:hypothetical protein